MRTLQIILVTALILVITVNSYPQINQIAQKKATIFNDKGARWLPFEIPKEYNKSTAYWKLTKTGFVIVSDYTYFIENDFQNTLYTGYELDRDREYIYMARNIQNELNKQLWYQVVFHNDMNPVYYSNNISGNQDPPKINRENNNSPAPIKLNETSNIPETYVPTRTVVVYNYNKTEEEMTNNSSNVNSKTDNTSAYVKSSNNSSVKSNNNQNSGNSGNNSGNNSGVKSKSNNTSSQSRTNKKD